MSEQHESTGERKNVVYSWVVVSVLSAAVLLWGVVIYVVVGDRMAPKWDFGQIQDVPGESPYSTWTPGSKELPGTVPRPAVAGPEVQRQHVRGAPGAEGHP